MASVRKVSYGRVLLRISSGGGGIRSPLRGNGIARSAMDARPTPMRASDKLLPTAGRLFTMAKLPPTGARVMLCKEASLSAIAMGRQAQQGTRLWSGEGTIWNRLRVVMVKDRRIPGLNATTNLSNQCGHLSFVILALAYLETDVLALRGYAASGIGLSILFQFYRAQPLWIPISWNGLFLAINASMIALLVRERSEAANLGNDPEQAKIFRDVFAPVELTPVDFVRLMDLAERRALPKGTPLSREGRLQEDVFLIVEGGAEVELEGAAVGHLEQEQFVGSMAFNRFMQASARAFAASSSAVGTAVGDTSPAVTTGSSNDSEKTSVPEHGEDDYKNDHLDDEDSGSYTGGGGGGGVFEEAKEVALKVLRRDSIVGNMAQSLALDVDLEVDKHDGMGGTERSKTTVTATADVVVYAWDMHLLRAFIKRRPLAGAAFQKAVSADLIRKVDQSRRPEERYRLLLTEALDGGVITPIEKKKLHRYRDMHGISTVEHKELLREHDWREEEFEAGFQKGVVPRDGSKDFLKYEALVRRELANGEVQDKGRQNLRKFRARAGIDAHEHLVALEKQGWTADDYEVGCKGKAADLAEDSADRDDDAQREYRHDTDDDDSSTGSGVVKSDTDTNPGKTWKKAEGGRSGGGVTATTVELDTTNPGKTAAKNADDHVVTGGVTDTIAARTLAVGASSSGGKGAQQTTRGPAASAKVASKMISRE